MAFFYRRPFPSQCCESLHRPDGDGNSLGIASEKVPGVKKKKSCFESCRWFCSSNFSLRLEIFYWAGRWKLIITGGELELWDVIYSTAVGSEKWEHFLPGDVGKCLVFLSRRRKIYKREVDLNIQTAAEELQFPTLSALLVLFGIKIESRVLSARRDVIFALFVCSGYSFHYLFLSARKMLWNNSEYKHEDKTPLAE